MNRADKPFVVLGWAAIVVAGVLGAAMASWPSRLLVWAMAYLILVVGVGQYALGVGQARLGKRPPAAVTLWGQWLLLNAGHAGVMGGTLFGRFAVVSVATVPYVLALLWFALRVHPQDGGRPLLAYRALLLLLLRSALTGVWLSSLSHAVG